MTKQEPRDKCQICGFEGYTSEFGDEEGICPNCSSTDIDDVHANPYEDDNEDEWFI